MTEIPLTFLNGDLKLEGIIYLPGVIDRNITGVVLCHPHPLYGGNMHNNVVMAVSRALAERGIAAFRFNFRGVGSSEGSFDDGVGEQGDLRTALAALGERPEVDPDRLGVMGYSFGGMVALNTVRNFEQVRALAAVSPVIAPGIMDGLSLPAYYICGTQDHVVSTELLVAEAGRVNPPGQVELVPGVDHFWGGQEQSMANKVSAFFEEVL